MQDLERLSEALSSLTIDNFVRHDRLVLKKIVA
jgi:hypothetical protein